MATPLNHPAHSMEERRGDIRSFYHSLSPNKSTIIRINTSNHTSSIDSTDSQKANFHLNKTKTLIKSLNLENNLSVNGLTSNSNESNDSIVVYRLSNDKNKDLLRKSTPSSQSTPSETGSHKKRYLVSQRSGKVYEIIERAKVNSTSVKREATEPDTDLICDDEYFKYLNLIGSKRLKTEKKSSLNQWSLRNISKVESKPKFDNYGKILLTEVCPKPSETDSTINEDNSEVSRRKLAKSQWLSEVKDNTNHRFTDNKEIEISRKRDKELKEWHTNLINTISFFEMSSFMAKRLFNTHFKPINQLEKYLRILDFEKHCSESYVKFLASMSLSTNGVTRITRTRDGSDWNPRNYQHNYCFNRFQRLEKWKQLETGLNWRSRLLKSNCKKLGIHIKRLNECPICTKTIGFEPRHQCYENEPHLRPVPHQKIASQSVNNSKEEEVIIIGDDFMSEDMTTNNSNENNCVEQPFIKPIDTEVIKTNDIEMTNNSMNNDEEEDDIIIVKEVFKTKDSNVIMRSLLKPNISFNCVKPPKKVATVSLNFVSTRPMSPVLPLQSPHELPTSLPSSSVGSNSKI